MVRSFLLTATFIFSLCAEADIKLSDQVKVADEQIKSIEGLLEKWVTYYNAVLACQSSGQVTAYEGAPPPRIDQTASSTTASPSSEIESLKAQVALLNAKVLAPNSKSSLEETRDAATQNAAHSAPILDVNTPARAPYMVALGLFQSGDYKKALEAFTDVIQDHPEDAYAHKSVLHCGECRMQLGDYGSAVADFEKALTLKLDPKFQNDARIALIQSKIVLNKKDEACVVMKQLEGEEKHLEATQRALFISLKSSLACATRYPAVAAVPATPTPPAEPEKASLPLKTPQVISG